MRLWAVLISFALLMGTGVTRVHAEGNDAPADQPSINVGARDVNESGALHSTPVVFADPEMTRIVVRHGRSFEILVDCQQIDSDLIESCWLAMTDSGCRAISGNKLARLSDYYVPIFGIAIVKLSTGEYLTKNFYIDTTWKPEDKDSIPDEHPFAFPDTDQPELHTLLADWWNNVVIPDCEESWYGEFLKPEPVE